MRGEGLRTAMEIAVKMGELYGARRLLPVKNAHIDAASYTTIWDAGTEFIEYLVSNGAKVAVPTTINPVARDIENWKSMGLSKEFSEKSRRLEDAYISMGVIPTWTCAPYQCTGAPAFGEILAWSESNAVNYANSVLGARANRIPDLIDVCCAVIGRVPEYGLYITENRAGDILFRLEGFDESWFCDAVDYAVLGYFIGEISIQRNPVIEGLPEKTTNDQLKALSAALASGGATALFHAVKLTPEARTLEDAFQSKTGYEITKVTPGNLIDTKDKLTTAAKGKADMVLLGCPHFSFDEIREVRDMFKGRKVASATKFWIMTSMIMYDLAVRAGVAHDLLDAGVEFIRDTCLMVSDTDKDWGFKTIITNSGKAAQYITGLYDMDVAVKSTPECVDIAIRGEW